MFKPIIFKGMKIATNILPRLNNLNVRLFADKDEQPVEKNYELMSACYHEGRTLSSGRYTSTTMQFGRKYYFFISNFYLFKVYAKVMQICNGDITMTVMYISS